MSEDGGKRQPNSPGDGRDERLAEISNTLAEMSSQLTTLAHEVRSLQAAWSSDERQSQRQQTAPETQAPIETQAPTATPASDTQSSPWSQYWGDSDHAPGDTQDPPPAHDQEPNHAIAASPRPTLSERLGREGVGSKVLSWVGGAVTLFGVLLLMILAIDRGWIGPVPRIIIAAALGIGLVGLATWLNARPAASPHDGPNTAEQHGPFALAATGFAILFIDIVATTAFLDLIPVWAGVLTGLVIAFGGLAFAYFWDSQRLAVFVLVAGAVCAPVLTGDFDLVLIAFLLVLLIAATPVELDRLWSGALLAAGLPPLIGSSLATLQYAGTSVHHDSALAIAISSVIAAVVVVAVNTLTARRQHRSNYAGLALLISVPVPVMLTALILDRWTSALLIAIVGLLLVIVWGSQYVMRLPSAFAGVAAGAGAVLIFHATVAATDGDGRAFALLGQALLLGFLAGSLRRLGPLIISIGYGAVGLTLALAGPAPTEILVDAELTTPNEATLVLAALAAALIMCCAATIGLGATRVLSGLSQWIAVSVLGVFALYSTIGIVVSLSLMASPDRTGFLTGHSAVTVLWAVIALVLLIRGLKQRPLRISGLILVGAALAKLVMFDLASLDGLARVGAFLGAGLVLLTAGVRYARLVAAAADQTESQPERQE